MVQSLSEVYYLFVSLIIGRLDSLIEFFKKLDLAVVLSSHIVMIPGSYVDSVLVLGRGRAVDIAQGVRAVEFAPVLDQLGDRDSVVHKLVLLSSVSQSALGPAVPNRGIWPI